MKRAVSNSLTPSETRVLCLHLLAALATACGGDDTSALDSRTGDTTPDAGSGACDTIPEVDTTWSGGSLLYCGYGTASCGATATPDGPCLCTQEWSTPYSGPHCGGAVVSPDGGHTYQAWCNPRTGVCRCAFDGDECYCQARPARACSDLCSSDIRGCMCGAFPDGTPRSVCVDTCGDPELGQCCLDSDSPNVCNCWEPRSDVCERSLNCCWTGGNAI